MNDVATRVHKRTLQAVLALTLSLVLTTSVVLAQSSSTASASSPQAAAPSFETALANLRWREIGPANMGGRIDDFAVVESDPRIVYVATASGGLWRTTNAGTTWEPLFDDQPVSTIGDVTLAPSDPSIVWVGTGEPNNRQSSSWGNGVFKSTDAGKTWTNMGLAETHHIARIVIHPTNPNVVYVAAVGRLWGPSRERGVYKTTDGGRTWTNVLFINEDTGVIDIAMDQESPDTLFAAAYQRRRTVFGFSGSGPGSALYKTTDGGTTWRKLTKGLPYDPEYREGPAQSAGGGGGGGGFGGGGGGGAAFQLAAPRPQAQPVSPAARQETGRIGVTIYRKNSNIVYTLVEHAQGGIFRSEDKGETWTKMSDTNPRPMYYSQPIIDPSNDLRIWVMGAPMFYSEDGGRTFRTNRVSRIHGDYHAMWINPQDSNHMIVGSDGGIHWSHDAGQTWDFVNTVPLGQFYEVGLDMRKPYYICGGLQDNGSWCGPSATTYFQGITNEDWFRVGGGDGFFVQLDPTDPNIVYSESQDGNIQRRDLRTNESKSIRPVEAEGDPRFRFQWNSPIVISAHDAKTIYYGAQFLFRSNDRGDTWTKISPDLTTGQDRDKLPIMGKVPDRDTRSRHDGVQAWPTLTTISESPRNANVLWVGTDDGNLQVTRDGGKSWKNVADKVPGVPKGTYVSRVLASRHADGTAYVTFDGHRMNDFKVYVFATADFGETWKSISGALPQNNGIVNVIREHHRNADLLFAGTEYGAFVSFDRGATWTRLKMNLPTVPVDDIAIHPRDNDLVFGTHGRSVWVLDDITPLEQMNAKVLASDLHLFDLRPATVWRMYGHKGSTGHKMFIGRNPEYGALIHYYLKTKPGERDRVRITVTDASGKTVRTLNGAREAGINRVAWDLRAGAPPPPDQEQPQQPQFGFGFGFGAAAGLGPRVEPGTYTIKVSIGNNEQSKTVTVEEDPRIQVSAADRAARRELLDKVWELSQTVQRSVRQATSLRNAVRDARESWRRPGGPRVPEDVAKAAEELAKKVDDVAGKFINVQQQPGQLGAAGPPLTFTPPNLTQRVGRLFGQLEGYTAAPTALQKEEAERLAQLVPEAAAALQKVVAEDLVNLNKLMNEAGVPHIRVPVPETRTLAVPRGDAGSNE